MNKIKRFILESVVELKKVHWPTKQETIRLTGYVIGVSLGVGLLVALFDYLFKELLTYIITG